MRGVSAAATSTAACYCLLSSTRGVDCRRPTGARSVDGSDGRHNGHAALRPRLYRSQLVRDSVRFVHQRRLVYPSGRVRSSRRTDRVHCPSANAHWRHLDAYHTDHRHIAVQCGLCAVYYVSQPIDGPPSSVRRHVEHDHVRAKPVVAGHTVMRPIRSRAAAYAAAAYAAACLFGHHAGMAGQPSRWKLDTNRPDERAPELQL